jgi:hypothetical protein
MENIFTIHLICSFFLCGLIWTIQMVHYPSFKYVSDFSFQEFSTFHQKNITLIVGPFMLIELLTGLGLLLKYQNAVSIINIAGILLVFLVTVFVSMPLHKVLSQRKSYPAIDKLVSTNWIRTVVWSLRSLLLLYIVSLEKGVPV